MTDARQLPPTEEERMLEHIRQHSHGEPPASLDALIMATARREAPAPKPSLWQRWFDLCRQPRWQVAFAGLFGVTLLLGVLQRTPEPAPRQVLAPAPMAKAAAPSWRAARPNPLQPPQNRPVPNHTWMHRTTSNWPSRRMPAVPCRRPLPQHPWRACR